jgi:ElaB/YqjD/DUF883 family membrane-anchored ribosome-binding protein
MRAPINRLESIWPRSEPPDVIAGRESASLGNKARSWEHSLENLLSEHPKFAIAAAAAVGIVLGWIVKRK